MVWWQDGNVEICWESNMAFVQMFPLTGDEGIPASELWSTSSVSLIVTENIEKFNLMYVSIIYRQDLLVPSKGT